MKRRARLLLASIFAARKLTAETGSPVHGEVHLPAPGQPIQVSISNAKVECVLRDLETGALKLIEAVPFVGTSDDGWGIQAKPVTAGARKRWRVDVLVMTLNPEPHGERMQAIAHRLAQAPGSM